MSTRRLRRALLAVALAGALGASGCAQLQMEATGQQIRLWGSNEVPPVSTPAYGTGTVNIASDRSVSVTLSVLDMVPTAAHIHEGAAGANGPVIVTLNKISEQAFVAPPNARLTEAQYNAYKAGNTYVNVHSTKFPNGEVRAQLAGR